MPSFETWRWYVEEILEPGEGMSWEEAFGWVAQEDVTTLERAIAELESEGRVRVSLRQGGYVLVDEAAATD